MSAIFQKGSSFFLAVFLLATLFCLSAHHHAEAPSANLSDTCALCVLGHATPATQEAGFTFSVPHHTLPLDLGHPSPLPASDRVNPHPARAPPIA